MIAPQKPSAPLRVTQRIDYALRSVVHLCLRGDEFVTAEQIAEHDALSVKMLSDVLRSLRAAGVLESRPGWHGGFRLGRPADQIPVGTVIAAVAEDALRGDVVPVDLPDSAEGSVSDKIRSFWTSLDRQVQSSLTTLTVADLAAS